MIGVSSSGIEAINQAVESMFDRIARQFIGDIPKLKDSKSIIMTVTPNYGLANLFVQALGNRYPNALEKDVLKTMLMSADGYLEALKNTTKSNVANRVDALAREAKIRGEKMSMEQIEEVLADEMKKARSKMQTIAEAESTKTRNMGSQVDIAKVAASYGEDDPKVAFIVVRDGSECHECIRLHLMPDGVTPRVWKMSEVKQGYHVRGENFPSACGEHPWCRCGLVLIPPGFSFNASGNITYKSKDYDALAEQRSED